MVDCLTVSSSELSEINVGENDVGEFVRLCDWFWQILQGDYFVLIQLDGVQQ